MPVLGFDVSAYNDSDLGYFKRLKGTGAKFVFIKLTEGMGWHSPVAFTQAKNAFKAGISVVGAYHFYHGGGQAEARQFLTMVKWGGFDNTTPLMIDAETPDIGTMAGIAAFLDECYNYGYHHLFIYSMASYFGVRIFPKMLQHGHLWVANYGGSIGVGDATIWQFTDNYQGTHTDGNYCYFPKRLGLDDTKTIDRPKDVIHVGKNAYYTKGSQFKVVTDYVTCYSDGSLNNINVNINGRDKDYVIHATPVKVGKYYRLQTAYGNYYTANTNYVKRLK